MIFGTSSWRRKVGRTWRAAEALTVFGHFWAATGAAEDEALILVGRKMLAD